MILPFKIETLFKEWPVMNWVIMAVTALAFLMEGSISREAFGAMILDGWAPSGLFGHLILHVGLLHLAGNLVFLWVFGNAVCGNTSNVVHPLLYLIFGLVAAATHNLFDGSPAVGASGAINGVVGMALAMYPLNRVSVFWFFVVRAGVFYLPLWSLALIWFAFDVWGAVTGGGGVAYWGHLGGFAAGLLVGVVALRAKWVTLTDWDNPSLVDILLRK